MSKKLSIIIKSIIIGLSLSTIVYCVILCCKEDSKRRNEETHFIIQSIKQTGDNKYLYNIKNSKWGREAFSYITSENLGMPGDTVKIIR